MDQISLDLNNPAQAREFCTEFVMIVGHGQRPLKPHYIDLDGNRGVRRILFAEMSDEDAILAANMLYDLQLEQLERAKARGELQ